MQSTLTLLDKALQIAPMPVWTKKFHLTRNAISTAKYSGKLTPVLAGNFALELGEDPQKWMAVAVIEGEKDSPAKQLLMKQLEKMKKLYLPTLNRKATHARKICAARIANSKDRATRYTIANAPNIRKFLNRVIAR